MPGYFEVRDGLLGSIFLEIPVLGNPSIVAATRISETGKRYNWRSIRK